MIVDTDRDDSAGEGTLDTDLITGDVAEEMVGVEEDELSCVKIFWFVSPHCQSLLTLLSIDDQSELNVSTTTVSYPVLLSLNININ